MESKMNEFIKITEGEKVALIDPVGKVCLGVSKRFADNLDKPEFQEKLFPVWKQQTEFIKEIENNHEKINTVYLMVTRKCNMNCDFCAISANDKLRPEKEFKLEDIQNKVIPFFQKNKPHKMILTGGEPLIKDQIVEIAKALRNGLTCPITLQSNGLAITKELTEQLKGYIDEIDFSTMHMFGTPEKEQQLINHIEMCQQAGIKVVLSFIYEKTNEVDLYRLIDIAAKYDINVLFNIVSSVGRAKENSKILSDMEHLDMNLKIAKYILKQGYENKKIGEAFYQRIQVRNSCGGYGKVMAIFPEGDIYMCQCMEKNQVRMGNILTDSSEKILKTQDCLLKEDEIKQLFCVDYKEICKEYYGYHRISTKEQHLDRGIIEIKRFCENQKIKLESIFTDKITGKNFDRPRYTVLVEDVLRVGDTLIITELDRLGRNKQEILKQLRFLEEKGVRVMVLELPTTLFDLSQMENNLAKMMIETINNMMIELYASMAQAEMEKKEKRQKEGMEAKRLRGEWDEVGRPRAIEQEKFNQEFMRVVQKKVTPTQLQRELGLTSSTYYRYRKNFYENFPEFLQSV